VFLQGGNSILCSLCTRWSPGKRVSSVDHAVHPGSIPLNHSGTLGKFCALWRLNELCLLVYLLLFVGLPQPLGRVLWRACATQGSSGIPLLYVGCNGSAESRVTRGSRRLLRSHDNDCHCLSKSKFSTLLNNSTTVRTMLPSQPPPCNQVLTQPTLFSKM
jgi:hypothetical protein